jgi:hypothetical protein
MSPIFRTVADYELHLYSLPTAYQAIRRSTVVLVRRGAALARVEGEIHFDGDLRLAVRERLLIDRQPLLIDSYGYEVWEGKTKLFWYDSQPHPDEPSLQSTHPHHKHVPPHIKRNRKPAPNMSFVQSNFPTLIEEIEQIIAQREKP